MRFSPLMAVYIALYSGRRPAGFRAFDGALQRLTVVAELQQDLRLAVEVDDLNLVVRAHATDEAHGRFLRDGELAFHAGARSTTSERAMGLGCREKLVMSCWI
jgi:hypothetical protein